MQQLTIKTSKKREVIDISMQIEEVLDSNVKLVNIFVAHSTAAVACVDLDPGTDIDYLNAIEALTPNIKWHHPHNPEHMPDHLWGGLIGPSLTVPCENGKLALGTWQKIILFEFDGAKNRKLNLTFI